MFGKIIHWLQANIGSIILALALSVTVWVVATLEESPPIERTIQPPSTIDVIGLDPNLIITNDYTKTTAIRLRAHEETWGTFSEDDIVVVADLTGLGPGIHQINLDIQIGISQTRLISASPDSIRIEIEERGEREFPVQLTLEGQPAIGYSVGAPTIEPASVTVRGPASKVDLVSEIRGQIDIEGSRDPVRDSVALLPLDSEGNQVSDVTIFPDTANVLVGINQVAGYKYVSIIPRTTGRAAQGYYVSNITITPAQIVLQGDPESLDNMQPYVEVFIDITGLTDDVIVEVPLNLPPGVTPIDQGPVEALVSVAAQPGSRSVLIPIEITGLGEGLLASLEPTEIEVILSGPLPVLDSLDLENDIVVTLDLSDLIEGIYQLEPNIEVLVSNVLVESYFPVVIEITIEEEPEQGSQ